MRRVYQKRDALRQRIRVVGGNKESTGIPQVVAPFGKVRCPNALWQQFR